VVDARARTNSGTQTTLVWYQQSGKANLVFAAWERVAFLQLRGSLGPHAPVAPGTKR